MRILMMHPDLGIGGAERLVVDVALACKRMGHEVSFVTNHHDVTHCFPETKDSSLEVTVIGDWFPRSIFGACYAACAYIRFLIAAFYVCFMCPATSSSADYDLVIIDQISAPIPILRLFGPGKVLFYCHFPDMMLTDRKSVPKKVYRWFVDTVEEVTTGKADLILVNSNFTAGVFRNAFKSLKDKKIEVLYPTCNFSSIDRIDRAILDITLPREVRFIFLSINRFERKKNLHLLVRAAKVLKEVHGVNDFHCIMAGGYDIRVPENVQHFNETEDLIEELELDKFVTLFQSPSDVQKHALLHSCTCVVYTPSNEHFGIVPLEAMYMGKAVIACKSGGPLETVVDGVTGLLRDPTPESFAEAMNMFVEDKSWANELGSLGKERVAELFSPTAFQRKLKTIIDKMALDMNS